jgi:TonB family protein
MRVLFAVIAALFLLIAGADLQAQEITKKKGKYKFYYPNGKVSSSGKVKNYHRNGQWKYYDENGNVVTIANFVLDTIHGKYDEFYSDGKPFIKGQYCMNKKCGNWKTYDMKGKVISDENFVDGQPNGIQRYWYPDGVMRDSLVSDHGMTTYLKSWYKSGKVKAIETYKEGRPHGKWFLYPEFSSDTFPETTDEYKNGLKHGWHYAWKGKTLIQSFHYADGELDGACSRFDEETGKLSVEENYSEGQLHGTSKYYRNGLIIRADQYENGLRNGAQIEYAREGHIMKRKWFTYGVLDSMYTYYANGKTAVKQIYIPGTTNSTWIESDANGFLLIDGYLRNERRDGNWCVYYTNGKKHSCTPYKDGQIQGIYTRWYANGKKMLEYEIAETGQVVKATIWNEKGVVLKPASKEFKEIFDSNLPGSMFTDMRDYNRNVVDRVVDEGRIDQMDVPTVEWNPGVEDYLQELNQKAADTNQVYSYCEIMPEFPGGWDEMREYVAKNTSYPANQHAEGVVYVSYIVEKNGYVSTVEVVKGIPGADALNEEAKRVVSTFPPHTPGKNSGYPVRSKCVIPIRFTFDK